jgi:transcriptional regulator with XRE-family HTH domain
MALAHGSPASFGELLRAWRMRRRLSQLELAAEAAVSTRHLSFIETGRARPSREMVIHLAEHLEIPLRERNALLMAAGFAPAYEERALEAPEMASVHAALDLVLGSHEPYPAIVVDRYWNVVKGNRAASLLLDGVAPELLAPPVNVYRVSFHPAGLSNVVVNFGEYAAHLLAQLRHDVAVSGDPRLEALLQEVEAYPTVASLGAVVPARGSVVLPMRLRHPEGDLALFSTIATFGTPVDVTVAELAVETFFPADGETARVLRALATG